MWLEEIMMMYHISKIENVALLYSRMTCIRKCGAARITCIEDVALPSNHVHRKCGCARITRALEMWRCARIISRIFYGERDMSLTSYPRSENILETMYQSCTGGFFIRHHLLRPPVDTPPCLLGLNRRFFARPKTR
jgi:hypothetical protein